MPYFKDAQNNVYFIPAGCVPINEEEAQCLQTSAGSMAQELEPAVEKTEDEIEQERILFQMSEIERQITPRRLREAILTDEGREWLMSWEMELRELRNELKELKKA
ncbi:MAG: hypothetical protein LBD67_00540 [Candidatus Accumulibacter sp.]|jgi:hypothetical protein|nr:hypothetical protein [Accumulibacter sp.]